MRLKSLSILASLLVFALAITSCLDSDNDYVPSSDTLITAFELDKIYGVNYKFTIDQLKGEIYNVDSIPFSADTIINKILIKTFTTTAMITTGEENVEPYSKDTLFQYRDSIDFMKFNPLIIRARSLDGQHIKRYTIKVNRHQHDPDTLIWGKVPYIPNVTGGKITSAKATKAVLLNNNMLLYAAFADKITVYQASGTSPWGEEEVNLPTTAKLSSIVNLRDTLYIAGGDGKIYRSISGTNWEVTTSTLNESPSTFLIENLFTTFNGNSLSAIVNLNDTLRFATAVSSEGVLKWIRGSVKPAYFPTEHIVATPSFTTPTGGQQSLLMGNPTRNVQEGETAIASVWFSTNGLNWGEIIPNSTKFMLPAMKEPTIVYYGDSLYAFGETTEGFSYIYRSINGIVWEKLEKKFMFPLNSEGKSVFKDRNGYAMVVDNENFIWMFWNKQDEAWRGRLNKLIVKR